MILFSIYNNFIEIFFFQPPAKRLKQLDDYNVHRSEETTDNIISDEELNGNIVFL